MSKTSLFVIAAATVLMLGLGGWAVSMPHGRVAPSTGGLQIHAIQSTIDAKTCRLSTTTIIRSCSNWGAVLRGQHRAVVPADRTDRISG